MPQAILDELPPEQRRPDLAAGLGVVVFDGPQGPGFYKGGHDDATGNTWVCVKAHKRCVVILANDVRAEAAFPRLVEFILGETVPFFIVGLGEVGLVTAVGGSLPPHDQRTALPQDFGMRRLSAVSA